MTPDKPLRFSSWKGPGFSGLRGGCQVTGSRRVTGDRERRGGRVGFLPGSQTPLGEVAAESAIRPGAQGHRKFKRGGARNKQVSKIARRPALAPPGSSQRRGQRGLDGPVCGRYLPRPQVEPRPQLQVGTCKPGLTLSRFLGARESKGDLVDWTRGRGQGGSRRPLTSGPECWGAGWGYLPKPLPHAPSPGYRR